MAQVIGFIAGAATIVLSLFLSGSVAGTTRWVLLAPICLAVSRDHVAWSSSGLEMGLFVFLLLAAIHAAIREREQSTQPVSAVLAAVAILVRPEGAVLGLLIGIFGIITLKDRGLRLGIIAILLVPFFVFRIGYYNEFVPNTVTAKAGIEPLRGLFYFGEFLRSHPGIPIWALPSLLFMGRLRWVGFLGVAHILILVLVGGDFMEFRLAVPLAVLAACCLPYFIEKLRSWLALCLVLASILGYWFGSLVEYRQYASSYMIENVRELDRNARRWSRLGKFMNTAMRSHELIAVGPAGAIPYYSKLPTIDMLGLCDSWVAKFGELSSGAAGHRKVAPMEYLEQRDVVWIVGQPDIRRAPDRREEKISVQVPWGDYLVLDTTLNADSLRSVLRARGFAVASADTADTWLKGKESAEKVIRGWDRLAEGDIESSRRLARAALKSARSLGREWRWLLREAGFLEIEVRERVDDSTRESKPWESIAEEVPEAWRNRLGEAKEKASAAHLDSAEK
jgi:hypothetical protein